MELNVIIHNFCSSDQIPTSNKWPHYPLPSKLIIFRYQHEMQKKYKNPNEKNKFITFIPGRPLLKQGFTELQMSSCVLSQKPIKPVNQLNHPPLLLFCYSPPFTSFFFFIFLKVSFSFQAFFMSLSKSKPTHFPMQLFFPPRLLLFPLCPNMSFFFFLSFYAPSLLFEFLMQPLLGYHWSLRAIDKPQKWKWPT